MKRIDETRRKRIRRKRHIRKKITGTAMKPRMSVFKSNKHLYVQVIDDSNGSTLAAASDIEKDMKDLRPTVENASKIGEAIGKRLKEKKIETIVFDRNGFLYHGIVKALADGVRKTGIKF